MKTRIVCLTTAVFSLCALTVSYGDCTTKKECPKGSSCHSICKKECPGKKCQSTCPKKTEKPVKKERSKKGIDAEAYKQEGTNLLNEVHNLKDATKKEEWKLFHKINRFVKKAGDNVELGETAKMVITEANSANKFKTPKITDKMKNLQPGKKTWHSKKARSKKGAVKDEQKK